jgi:hypothetical protein
MSEIGRRRSRPGLHRYLRRRPGATRGSPASGGSVSTASGRLPIPIWTCTGLSGREASLSSSARSAAPAYGDCALDRLDTRVVRLLAGSEQLVCVANHHQDAVGRQGVAPVILGVARHTALERFREGSATWRPRSSSPARTPSRRSVRVRHRAVCLPARAGVGRAGRRGAQVV